ncbi:class A beta-lactamase, subclass A2 [Pedobacter sp. GR22-6]|uniref:class A beta-lactamase, subclass A2 n=1 Tax=Pedobacter sp. GR22-6 TaxID=3127957 RepID=UPI00307D39FD
MKSILSLLFGCFLWVIPAMAQQQEIRQQLQRITDGKSATVGISLAVVETGDTVSLDGNRRFPMQSVYKFHLALAVLDLVDKGKLRLHQKLFLKKGDLLPDTHSPLRDKYPNGNVSISIDELLRYTAGQSDNNGCDILFRLVGGPKYVNRYIKNLGIKEVAIVATEEEMHKDHRVQFRNYSTPQSATALLLKFTEGKVLQASSMEYLRDIMQNSPSGPKKLKGLLPSGTAVAHKTGYSGTDDSGLTYATNDIGIVTLPNGNHMVISVFVSMSREEEAVNDRIIAELAKAAYDRFSEGR